MAAVEMDKTADHQNGPLSFTNPNYHLDDAVNCNNAAESGDDLYEEIYQELDSVCNFKQRSSAKNRRNYANMDISSMGIDINNDPATSARRNPGTEGGQTNRNGVITTSNHLSVSSCDFTDNERTNSTVSLDQTGNGYLGYYINVDTWRSQSTNGLDLIENMDGRGHCNVNKNNVIEEEESPDSNSNGTGSSMDLNSPDSMDTATTEETPLIPHIAGQLNNDLYAVLIKHNKGEQQQQQPRSKLSSPIKDKKGEDSSPVSDMLPPGWERHEDHDGPYYWHIKSGTIQRDPPPPLPLNLKEDKKSISNDSPLVNSASTTSLCGLGISVALPPIETKHVKDNYKRKSYPRVDQEKKEKAIRFAVRSLGWVEIAEEDLTPERSSKAVNKCIVDLSLGRNDILDVVGRWGDGKDLFMDLDHHSLKLIDPENLNVLNTQPIHTIRVWGVGRDNGRDFAYVARDRATRKHMCHVFRCDTPARTIANTLRDICKKIMIERSLTQNLGKAIDTSKNGSSVNGGNMARTGLTRPTNLPTEHRRIPSRGAITTYSAQSFPTPMEEPKKVLRVHYLGSTKVNKATGMDVLNSAIEQMCATVPMEQWQFVNVAVAPSTITISELGDEGKQLVECRVRFLSFLGIGKNVKHCAFIVHTAHDQFVAHIFHCEPSSGALCKTIEAACKLRYQKCLDAHPPGSDKRNGDLQNGKSIGAALKTVLGTLTGRRQKSGES